MILQKQPALVKVNEEDSVFEEPDGHIDILENSVAALFARGNVTNYPKESNRLVNGGLLDSIAPKPPVTTCSSHIYRGKCIGKEAFYCLLTAITVGEGHSDNGYSVYIGMDSNTGDLVAIYEWVLRCRQAKSDISRRQKQVCLSFCVCPCVSVCVRVCVCSMHLCVHIILL